MTQFQKSDFKCTSCGHISEFRYIRNIKSTNAGGLKNKILDFSIFKYSCPACKEVHDIEYELLYHDPDRKYIIWFQFPDAETTYFQNQAPYKMFEIAPREYKYRIVNSRQELAEKIRIFDANLDDKTIEIIKLGILVNGKNSETKIKNIYFQYLMSDIDPEEFTDDLGFNIEYDDHTDDVTIASRSEYIAYRRIMASDFAEFILDTGEWEKINLNTITEYSKMKEQGILHIRNNWKKVANSLPKAEAGTSALLHTAKHISKTGSVLQIGYKSDIIATKAEGKLPVIEEAVRNVLGCNYIIKIVVIE